MKALPMKRVDGEHAYEPCAVDEANYVRLDMPGPFPNRIIPVILRGSRKGTCCWSWNGDTEKPTLKPSISTTDGTHKCHTFVNDGMVKFLADCTHEFAGKTLPLNEVD